MLGSLVGAWLRKKAMDKGVRGGSSVWLTVAALGLIRRLYRDHAKKTEVIGLGQPLRPGDRLLVTYPGKPGRRTRKEQRLDDKRRTAEDLEAARMRARADAKQAKWERSRVGRKALARAERNSMRLAADSARRGARAASTEARRRRRRDGTSSAAER